VAVQGPGLPSRVNAQLIDQGWDATPGTVSHTGRDLDVALHDGDWLAVQSSDGSEAYSRAGNLSVDANGQLLTGGGQPVLGDNGPISVPPYSTIKIAADGTISIVPAGQSPNTVATVGRLRVVQAAPTQLERGEDGLMRAAFGRVAGLWRSGRLQRQPGQYHGDDDSAGAAVRSANQADEDGAG